MARMRRLSLAVGIPLAALGTAAPAVAAPPSTWYGGGEIVAAEPGKDFPGHAGDSNVSLLTGKNAARLDVAASAIVPCADGSTREVYGSGRSTVAADGSFTLTERRTNGKGKDRWTTELTLAGRFESDQRASGTITATSTGEGKTCTGPATFVAVTLPKVGRKAAPPPPNAVLRGLVGRTGLFDVVLRTSADAKRVVRANFTLPWRCNGKRGDEVFYEPGAAIRRDGTFTIDERWSSKSGGGTLRARVVVRGVFVSGGVLGTVRATATARNGRGRVVERCTSGSRGFTAVP